MLDFRFVNVEKASPATKLGEYKLNDIIEVSEEDDTYYRIYMDKLKSYAELPADKLMLSYLKSETWTLDNKNKNSKLVKSNSNGEKTIYLGDVLEQYGYDKLEYEVYPNKVDFSGITKELYLKKKIEYKE